jgi:hypothetical protein
MLLPAPPLEAPADSNVLALILAMPGSGKTRTMFEAAKGASYHRIIMSNEDLEEINDKKRSYLARKVAVFCKCGENEIPLDHIGIVVVHFDEIQSLMVSYKDDEESVVATLSKACDKMINPQGKSPRTWLKFVMTGTNVFTRTTIKIGTAVKDVSISLDGAFSLKFVTKLAEDHGLLNFFDGTNYLERCRHNRRFTEKFLCNVWNGSKKDGFDVADAYEKAFLAMKEQMSNQIQLFAPTVSQVACTVFAKLLAVKPDEIQYVQLQPTHWYGEALTEC